MCTVRGSELNVAGETKCRNGSLVCDTSVSLGEAYCSSNIPGGGGPECGRGLGTSCLSTADCIPGAFCTREGICNLPSSFDTTACRVSQGVCWIPSDLGSNDPLLCRESGNTPEIPPDYTACVSSEEDMDCTIDDSSACPGYAFPGKTECFATSRFCRATPEGLAACGCTGSTPEELARCRTEALR